MFVSEQRPEPTENSGNNLRDLSGVLAAWGDSEPCATLSGAEPQITANQVQ